MSVKTTSKDLSVRARIGRFIKELIYYIGNKFYLGLFNYGDKVLKSGGDIKVNTSMKPKRL